MEGKMKLKLQEEKLRNSTTNLNYLKVKPDYQALEWEIKE